MKDNLYSYCRPERSEAESKDLLDSRLRRGPSTSSGRQWGGLKQWGRLKRQRAGNILPLALMMTFVMLLVGIGLATVVLEGSRRARDTENSIAAYYMADAGIERQLFEIRKRQQTLADVAQLASAYPNAGKWVSTAGLEQSIQKNIPYVTETEFATLDLFDPDQLGVSANIDSLKITWTGDAELEVGYAQWTAGSTVLWPTEDPYVVQHGFGPSLDIGGLDPNRGYRLRLKAVHGTATNVVVQVFLNGQAQSFPGDVVLSAEGTYGAATQKIAVSMAKSDVLSQLYSYVLFSECQILKGVPGVPVCPQ